MIQSTFKRKNLEHKEFTQFGGLDHDVTFFLDDAGLQTEVPTFMVHQH